MKAHTVVRRRGSHIFYTIGSQSAGGRIRSIEKSGDLIKIQTRDLPACSVVPHPTTLPRAPSYNHKI
jgi:hypothetical protein